MELHVVEVGPKLRIPYDLAPRYSKEWDREKHYRDEDIAHLHRNPRLVMELAFDSALFGEAELFDTPLSELEEEFWKEELNFYEKTGHWPDDPIVDETSDPADFEKHPDLLRIIEGLSPKNFPYIDNWAGELEAEAKAQAEATRMSKNRRIKDEFAKKRSKLDSTPDDGLLALSAGGYFDPANPEQYEVEIPDPMDDTMDFEDEMRAVDLFGDGDDTPPETTLLLRRLGYEPGFDASILRGSLSVPFAVLVSFS